MLLVIIGYSTTVRRSSAASLAWGPSMIRSALASQRASASIRFTQAGAVEASGGWELERACARSTRASRCSPASAKA